MSTISWHRLLRALENAGAHDLSASDLAFGVSRTNGTVMLSSPEWIYMHHSLLIGQLTVTVPESVAFKDSPHFK